MRPPGDVPGPADLAGTVLASWRPIVAAVLLCLVAGGVVTETALTPSYTATARVFVADEQGQQVALRASGIAPSQTYVALAESGEVAQRAADELDLPVAAVESDVAASGEGLISIVAVADTARGAQRLAAAVTDSLVAVAGELRTTDRAAGSVRVVDPASLPERRTSPDLARNLVVSGLGGLLVAVLLSVAVGSRADVVRSRRELARVLQRLREGAGR